MAFAFLNRFRKTADPRDTLRPLYARLIGEARQPHWYMEGKVPDTQDGRFGMVTLIVALALLRLEVAGDAGVTASVLLTELFVEDMEGQIRELGIGDVVVGKHVGRMMSLLGGQLGAYRGALESGGDLGSVLRRNLYAEQEADKAAVAHATQSAHDWVARLAATPLDQVLAGEVA